MKEINAKIVSRKCDELYSRALDNLVNLPVLAIENIAQSECRETPQGYFTIVEPETLDAILFIDAGLITPENLLLVTKTNEGDYVWEIDQHLLNLGEPKRAFYSWEECGPYATAYILAAKEIISTTDEPRGLAA